MYQTYKINKVKKYSSMLLVIFIIPLIYSMLIPMIAGAATPSSPAQVVSNSQNSNQNDVSKIIDNTDPVNVQNGNEVAPLGSFPLPADSALSSQGCGGAAVAILTAGASCVAGYVIDKTKDVATSAAKGALMMVIAFIRSDFVLKIVGSMVDGIASSLGGIIDYTYCGDVAKMVTSKIFPPVSELYGKTCKVLTGKGLISQSAKTASLLDSNYGNSASSITGANFKLGGATGSSIYKKSVEIGLLLIPVMLLLAIIFAVVLNKPILIWHSIMRLPFVIIGIFLAPRITAAIMDIVDAATAYLLDDWLIYSGNLILGMIKVITPFWGDSGVGAGDVINVLAILSFGGTFIIIFIIIILVSVVLLWFLLASREIIIAFIVFFLPFFFGAAVFPIVAGWATKAIRLLLVTVVSKFFMLGSLALAFSFAASLSASGDLYIFVYILLGTLMAVFSPSMISKIMDDTGIHAQESTGTGAAMKASTTANIGGGVKNLMGL